MERKSADRALKKGILIQGDPETVFSDRVNASPWLGLLLMCSAGVNDA